MSDLRMARLSPRVSALIVAACAITLVIAHEGLQSMWDVAEWATWRTQFCSVLMPTLFVAAFIALAWLPGFAVPRLLRVATLLPLIQLVTIVFAAQLWNALQHDVATHWSLSRDIQELPPLWSAGLAFGGVVLAGVAIKHRRGEWAHATVMLALAYLLLIGLWLPILTKLNVTDEQLSMTNLLHFGDYEWRWHYSYSRTLFREDTFVLLAVLPPGAAAIGFVTAAFRFPRLFARARKLVRTTLITLLALSVLAALGLSNDGWMLYLHSSYIVMFAVLLAVCALVQLTVVSWLASAATYLRYRGLVHVTGTIARDDDAEPAARFEITSWLRGPRLAVRSFVVTTPQGNIPLAGAAVVTPVGTRTLGLDVGQHADVLAPGDRVVLGITGARRNADATPFRAIDAVDVAMVGSPDARRYRFSDVALVVWRPAVAYLAILVAVALPGLMIFLT